MMFSGMHTVADIFCVCCGQIVGWKYVRTLSLSLSLLRICTHSSMRIHVGLLSNPNIFYFPNQEVAHEKSQKYKEGKSVLERYSPNSFSGLLIHL